MEEDNHNVHEHSFTSDSGSTASDVTLQLRRKIQSDDDDSSNASTGNTTVSMRRTSLSDINDSLEAVSEDSNDEEVLPNANQSQAPHDSSEYEDNSIRSYASSCDMDDVKDDDGEINSTRNTLAADSIEDMTFQGNNETAYENVSYDVYSDSTDLDTDSEASIGDEENERHEPFAKLIQMLASDDSNNSLTANFVVNKIEILLAILKFSTKYSLPNSAVADLCKMFNSFVDKPIIPDSRYKIDQLFYPGDEMRYFAVCSSCQNFIKEYTKEDLFVVCGVCDRRQRLNDPSYHDFFVVLNFENDLRHVLETNSAYYWEIMNNRNVVDEHLVDFHDGRKYKEFRDSLPEHSKKSHVTMTFNSDGSPVFQSSKFSVWPIQVNLNEIPASIRNKRSITYALWFGKGKPNMNIFFSPFVEDINRLSEEGIDCIINNERKNIKVFALCCCVDSVARPAMQGFTQFNGYYGCGWCLHPGQQVVHNNSSTMKYPIMNDIQRRSEENTLQYIRELIATDAESVKGVKHASQLITLKRFNIIDGFVPDAMHCIALGVAKQFANYWFQPSREPFRISKKNVKRIDKWLKSFKVPSEIARLTRPINDRKYWKAREWENWILYYSLPLLNEIRTFHKYTKHWSLLVESFYILMKDSISFIDLTRADKLLKEFTTKTQLYYSTNAMTYNVHQLSHMSQSVADWGPLWTHIGYPFESGNGQIVRSVHAAKGVLNQMCRNLSVKKSVQMLEKHIAQVEESPVIDYCEYLEKRYTKKTMKVGENRYFCKVPVVHRLHIATTNMTEDNVKGYRKLLKNNCVFKSCSKILQRSDNSYALTCDNEFIQIVQFLVDDESDLEYILYKRVQVEGNFNDTCTSMKKICLVENDVNIMKTSNLNKICVAISVKNHQYISAIPNNCTYS